MKIHYLCDKMACSKKYNGKCPDDHQCKYTHDIKHAKNFELINGIWIEKIQNNHLIAEIGDTLIFQSNAQMPSRVCDAMQKELTERLGTKTIVVNFDSSLIGKIGGKNDPNSN